MKPAKGQTDGKHKSSNRGTLGEHQHQITPTVLVKLADAWAWSNSQIEESAGPEDRS